VVTINKEVFVRITVPFPDNPKLFAKVMNMLLIIEDLKSYLRFFVSVIARLGGCVTMKNLTLMPQNVVAANFSLRRIYVG
jgi:hypothetical protein